MPEPGLHRRQLQHAAAHATAFAITPQDSPEEYGRNHQLFGCWEPMLKSNFKKRIVESLVHLPGIEPGTTQPKWIRHLPVDL